MLLTKSPRIPEESAMGVITVLNWTLAPDGRRYLYFWARRWQVITDADIPVEHFRSSEKWQLIAVGAKGEVLALFPGCQVKAWIGCAEAPPVDCFAFHDE